MLTEGHHGLHAQPVTTCASAKGAPDSHGGALVPAAAPEVKDGGRRGSSAAIYTMICRAAGRNCRRSRACQPYLMVFLLVVVLETILTLPPVLELTPRLLPELKELPPP